MLKKQFKKASKKKTDTLHIGVTYPAYSYERKDKGSPGKFSNFEARFGRNTIDAKDTPRVKVRMNNLTNSELRQLTQAYNIETGKMEDWSSKDKSFIIEQKRYEENKIRQEYARRIALLNEKKAELSSTEIKYIKEKAKEKRDEALAKIDKRYKEILSSLQEMRNRKNGVRKITVKERDGSVYDASVPIGSENDPLKEKKIVRNRGKAIYKGKKGTPKIVKTSNQYS